MVRGKLECVEVIWTKEPIQQLGTYGSTIFVIPRRHGVKVRFENDIVLIVKVKTQKNDS